MDMSDAELVQAVLRGGTDQFEVLIARHQARVFATARRYARREDEIEDIVQEVFIKAFQKLSSFRGEAPFEHWLMRLAVRTCYDFLRGHQKNRESLLADLTDEEDSWLDRFAASPESARDDEDAARALVQRILDQMSPDARLIITLSEVEGRSLKEIAELTGWSLANVKVRAFRARNQMRQILTRIKRDKFL